MHSIPIDKQQRILSLLQQNPRLSIRQVAQEYIVYHKTVEKLRKIHLPDLNLLLGGRPQKLKEQNKHYCIRAITSGKLQTAVAVQKDLDINLGIKVNEITIRRALKNAGLQAMKKEKRPK